MRKPIELKVCPFCGKPPKITRCGSVIIGCANRKCQAQPEICNATRGGAARGWNNRYEYGNFSEEPAPATKKLGRGKYLRNSCRR